MDETVLREVFETALAEHVPGFGTFFLARLLELEISYPDEKCRITFPIRAHFFNPGGTLHGGIIATVMDISMGHLLRHALGAGGATLQMNLNYLRPLTEGQAVCESRFLRRGRSICHLESQIFQVTGQPAASATATWKPRPIVAVTQRRDGTPAPAP